VLARASDGSVSRDTVTVHYQPGKERSLALEVFLENEKRSLDLEVSLEKEKSLKLEVERLGKNLDQIQRDIERNRDEGLRQSPTPPPSTGEVP
jgi:hypothetical protein